MTHAVKRVGVCVSKSLAAVRVAVSGLEYAHSIIICAVLNVHDT